MNIPSVTSHGLPHEHGPTYHMPLDAALRKPNRLRQLGVALGVAAAFALPPPHRRNCS